MEKLDYIEAESRATADFHIACADALAGETNTTVALLFAGAAGALAYAVNLYDKTGLQWAAWGMAAASLYLFALSGLTVYHCLRVRPIYPSGNMPGLLLDAPEWWDVPPAGAPAQWFVDHVREANLRSKDWCIRQNIERNDIVGHRLNLSRLWAAAVPLAFIAGSVLGAVVC